MAIKGDMFIDQGADFSSSIEITNESDEAVDLSIYTVRGHIRKYYQANTYTAFGSSVSNNIITLSLTHGVTANLAAGRYVFDVELINTESNNVLRILEGVAVVSPEVTK